MSKIKNKKSKFIRGFTLIEAIVAIGVISVGFVGALVLLSKSASQVNLLKNRVIAAHLAEEGVEVVYNIRDTNWLNPANPGWRNGLDDTANGIVNYDSLSVTVNSDQNSWCLNWDGAHYKHATGPSYICSTTFKRHIEIQTKDDVDLIDPDTGQKLKYMEVKSVVTWQEKGQTHPPIVVIDNLYGWK